LALEFYYDLNAQKIDKEEKEDLNNDGNLMLF
jgi:hypothetical protein